MDNQGCEMNKFESNKNHEEYQYLDHIRNIMENGTKMIDRTGVGTMSIFGAQMRWSLRDGEISVINSSLI